MPTRFKLSKLTLAFTSTSHRKATQMGARGRPSKYDSKYCEQLIEHCSQGKTIRTFAYDIGVNQDTLYEWSSKHPDFSEALNKGHETWQKWCEQELLSAYRKEKDVNTTVLIFLAKTKGGYQEKQNIELSGKDGGPIVTARIDLSDEQLSELTQKALASRIPQKAD